MNRVQVVAYPERHNGMRSCASDKKLPQVKRLLSYGRDGEGIESLDTDVVIRFDDDEFEGQSFGLALTLADKQARLNGESGRCPLLCATGIISNKGKISAVDQFADKVALANQFLPKGSIFVYPLSNQSDDEVGLDLIAASGIQIVATADLMELGYLWGEPNRRTIPKLDDKSKGCWHPLIQFTVGLLVGLGIPVSLVFAYFAISGS